MNDAIFIIIFTIIGFMFGCWAVVNTNHYQQGTVVNKLLADCEKTLPRDVKCYIKAVPEVPKAGDYNWPPNKFH